MQHALMRAATVSRCMGVLFNMTAPFEQVSQHAAALHDRMTECVYESPLESFE